MRPAFWKLLLLLFLAACDSDHTFVRVDRLAPGGGDKGDGGAGVYVDQDLCILVHLEADATGFRPETLFRLFVDGIDRVDGTVIGGIYALLTISPSPTAASLDVELFLHNGTFADSFTYNTIPQAPATTRSGSAGRPHRRSLRPRARWGCTPPADRPGRPSSDRG